MKRSLVYGTAALGLAASAGMAQIAPLTNGVVGDGALNVNADGYGAYSNWGWAANLDSYDPRGAFTGAAPAGAPMFAGSWMFYTPGLAGERVAFAEPFFDIDNTYNLRAGTFDLPTELSPIAMSMRNVANDTADFSWNSTNFAGTISMDMALHQECDAGPNATGVLTQELTITNRGASQLTGQIQRHLDIDALWTALSAEDVAGSVDCNGSPVVYVRDPDGKGTASETLMSLSSPDQVDYVASKSGYEPAVGQPGSVPMAYGTDFQIWDVSEYPTGWRNYTGGVGTWPTVGELPGAQPAGSAAPFDTFINMEWQIDLAPGESTTITNVFTYGGLPDCGPSCPACACQFDTSTGNVCDIFDFLAFQTAFVSGDPCAVDLNTSTGVGVADIFDFLDFQTSFVTVGPCG